jgi:hypothetical protein
MLVGEKQPRSDEEARALRAAVAESDPRHRIGGGATTGQKRHADKVVRETDDRFRACLRLRRRLGRCRPLDCLRRFPNLAGELLRIEFMAQGRLIELCAKTGDSAAWLGLGPKRISMTDLLETSCDLISRGNKSVGDHIVESTLRNILHVRTNANCSKSSSNFILTKRGPQAASDADENKVNQPIGRRRTFRDAATGYGLAALGLAPFSSAAAALACSAASWAKISSSSWVWLLARSASFSRSV